MINGYNPTKKTYKCGGCGFLYNKPARRCDQDDREYFVCPRCGDDGCSLVEEEEK